MISCRHISKFCLAVMMTCAFSGAAFADCTEDIKRITNNVRKHGPFEERVTEIAAEIKKKKVINIRQERYTARFVPPDRNHFIFLVNGTTKEMFRIDSTLWEQDRQKQWSRIQGPKNQAEIDASDKALVVDTIENGKCYGKAQLNGKQVNKYTFVTTVFFNSTNKLWADAASGKPVRWIKSTYLWGNQNNGYRRVTTTDYRYDSKIQINPPDNP